MSRIECKSCGAPLDDEKQECPRCLLALASAESEVFSDFPDDDEGDLPRREEVARILPQYEIERCIGRGGMGVVYAARDKKLERRVALKLLNRELSNSDDFLRRFMREGRALAALNHPSIVTVHDFGLEEGLCYLVMELVEGTDLRHLIAAGEMKPEQALALVPQICDALQYAHERGVVHRDIKPENILVRPDGLVKVADFGIAKMADEPGSARLTHSRLVVGTPQYMAPEQVEHPLEVDHRADIYALGVVLYEMLTGELPLGRFEPPSARVLLDLRIDEVVLRSLEKSPERRYQAASEVKSEVDRIRTTAPDAAGAKAEAQDREPIVPRAAKAAGKVGWYALTGTSGIWWALFIFGVVSLATYTVKKVQDLLDEKPIPRSIDRGDLDDGIGVEPDGLREFGRASFGLAGQIIRDGSAEDVQALMKEAPPVRVFGEDAIPHPLFAAARRRDQRIMGFVIEAFRNDLDPRDDKGDTPLIVALEEGFSAGADLLVEFGADIRVVGSQGRTPILVAALEGDRGMVGVLLKRLPKTDIYARDANNEGVMHKAARSGSPEVVTLLHQAGIEGGFHNARDMTPLDLAVAAGHIQLFKGLLAAGDHETPAYFLRLALDELGGERMARLGTVIGMLVDDPRELLELGSPRGRVYLKKPDLAVRLMALEIVTQPEVAARLKKEALELWPAELPTLDLIDIRELSAGSAWTRVRMTRRNLEDWTGGPLPVTLDGNEGTRPGQGLLSHLRGY